MSALGSVAADVGEWHQRSESFRKVTLPGFKRSARRRAAQVVQELVTDHEMERLVRNGADVDGARPTGQRDAIEVQAWIEPGRTYELDPDAKESSKRARDSTHSCRWYDCRGLVPGNMNAGTRTVHFQYLAQRIERADCLLVRLRIFMAASVFGPRSP